MDDTGHRSKWFPYSYSQNKSDIIYRSSILNCQSDYGCGTLDRCEHSPKWRMFKFNEYFAKKHYDFLTIGCSVSYGSEIKKSDTWRSHLPNSIDLSVPGIGIDAIWHNLKYLVWQDQVNFKKIVILLPNLERKTFRIFKDQIYFNFITTGHDENNPPPNFAFTPRQMDRLMNRQKRYLVMNGQKYGQKVLKRFISWLNAKRQGNILISSWDDIVFDHLSNKIENKDAILPKFDYHHAPDPAIKHPSPQAHKKWFELISEKIF